jgi:glucose/arabinose dehydrogenase
LIEYLVTLKQPVNALTSHHGMPDMIPQLTRPITLRPFLNEELQVPPASGGAASNVQSGLVWFGQVPGFAQRFLVVHQAGMIWLVEKHESGDRKSVFADFTPEVFSARGPNGLLGLAFHPQFRKNRKYFLKYQVFEDGKIATVLVERQAAPDFKRDSGQPSRRLLKIMSVAEHHNGGCIEFGLDGFLYLGMGDSAPNFDPQGHGQDLRLLFGKMLRLDVDRRDPGLSYGIPADNPFRGRPDVRPEIWAYGLREPWRFSFDPVTGDLWVADLGQERGDEVAIVRRGENHGWNVYEGFELFSNEHRQEGAIYVPPIFASRRKDGSAVMGGHVYRGDPHSSFYGVYVFGDHLSKRIWGLTQDNRSLKTIRQLATSPQAITSFATDEQGNIYVVGYQGMIYQLDFSDAKFDEPVGVSSARSAIPSGTDKSAGPSANTTSEP